MHFASGALFWLTFPIKTDKIVCDFGEMGENMKYVREFFIIIAVTFGGEIIKSLIPLPIPTSIYGLVLMLILLCTGVIRVEWVEDTSKFLVAVMPLMFIPPAAGLIDVWGVIRPILVPLAIVTILSTLIVIFCSGWISQLIIRAQEKHHAAKEER